MEVIQHTNTMARLFQEEDLTYLKNINKISFTTREVDILACVLNGRTAKKIGSLLSISPNTVENHIRNILMKLNLNSQEQIRDFIEHSGKCLALKTYYSKLLISIDFKLQIKKLYLKFASKNFSCIVLFNKENPDERNLASKLETHLQMLGIKAHKQDKLMISSRNKFESHHKNFLLFLKTYDLNYDALKDAIHTELSSSPEKLFEQNFSFLFIVPQNNYLLQPLLNDLNKKGAVCHEIFADSFENYYFFFFEILNKFFPGDKDLNKITREFKKYHDSLLEDKHDIGRRDENLNSRETQPVFWWAYKYKTILTPAIFAFGLLGFMFFYLSSASRFLETTEFKMPSAPFHIKYNYKNEEHLFWNLPRQDNIFVGRKKLLLALEDKLELKNKSFKPKEALGLCVCVGLGGVGKTQLALNYAHTSKHPYRLRAWFPAENIEQLKYLYLEFAKKLGLSIEKPSQDAVIQNVKEVLEKNPGWLLVFDNVNSYKEIAPFLPEKGGRVLITSRNHAWPDKFNILEVEVMSEQEALELLKVFINPNLNFEEEKTIKKLSNMLGFLPLALSQAGAYIKNKAIKPEEYIELHNQYEGIMLANQTMPEGTDHLPVSITWDVSLKAIEKEAEAKNLKPILHSILLPLAYLHAENIPRNLILQFLKKTYPNLDSNILILEEYLALLRKYSLITLNKDTVSIHRLLQAVIREQYRNKNVNFNYTKPSIKLDPDWYEKLLGAIDEEFWKEAEILKQEQHQRVLLPHLQALVKFKEQFWPEQDSENLAYVMSDIGWVLQHQIHNINEGGRYLEAAIALLKKHHPDLKRLSKIMNAVGICYREQLKLQEAKTTFEKVLKIKEKYCGENSLEVAATLNSLGITFNELALPNEARECLERALKIKELFRGKDDVDFAKTMTNLGKTFQLLKDFEKAKNLMETALKIELTKYGEENGYVAKTLGYLGSLYLDMGQLQAAKEVLERSLKIKERHFHSTSIHIAYNLEDLGRVYKAMGDFAEAKVFLKRALVIRENYYGLKNQETLELKRELENLSRFQDQEALN